MKNVNLITLNGYKNYGNRLQNYALTRTLETLGCNVSLPWFIGAKQKLKYFLKHHTFLKHKYPKEYKLYKFSKTYTTNQKPFVNKGDYTIVGSDQVWNPNSALKQSYLLFNPYPSTTILSYAASLGVNRLSKGQEATYKKALLQYQAISVREKSALKIITPLAKHLTPELVLDPTLLISSSEWQELEQRPQNVQKNAQYILCYILGNKDYENSIRQFAQKHNYQVIIFSDKSDSEYGVEEFLYLIHNAQMVCTDSFHACVFSLIFDTPFTVFKRTGELNYMYTRIENFLDTFKLKNREFNGKEITTANQKADYTEAKKILKKEQEKSLSFLEKALEVKDEK